MSIRVLDNNTVNKIAAGEVIENPASVVKELIENSIDADSKHITIEISDGGTKIIRVSDDGIGLEKSDIELAFLQHATSKINDISDLDTIKSFGFRGEALSSIAAVSNVVLITKSRIENNNYGYRYSISNNNKTSIEEVASNIGTIIEVRNLFENIPVRKKFLKGHNKENALVEDVVVKFALVRPDISFELIVDGKRKFYSSGDSNLKNIIYNLYGRDILDNLIEINEELGDMCVTGYIAKPIISRNTRNDEIYFVNDRYVKDKTIYKAIEAAYEEFMMQHKYPLVILKIYVDSSKIDVNVHPKKMEVRFSNNDVIYFSIYDILHSALKKSNLIYNESLNDDSLSSDVYNDNNEINLDSFDDDKPNDVQTNKTISIDSLPTIKDIITTTSSSGIKVSTLYKKLSNSFEEKPFIQKTLSEDHKYIGQVFRTYILVEFEDKLYIIDQHAAHEKINFERIMKSYKEGKVLNQRILPSIILRLTPMQYEAVIDNLEAFKSIGYEIESFGDNDIKVDAVPYNILNISNEKLLMDMIDSFSDEKNKEQYDSIVEKIASISCKKAIKANYILSENEVKQLLRDLFSLDNPYNCPHGRPTIISLSKQEFEKKFRRIV